VAPIVRGPVERRRFWGRHRPHSSALPLGGGDPWGLSTGGLHVTGPSPTSVSIGDLNRDGHPDLAVSNYDSESMSILLSACD
jgi:hypothetical protein